MEKKTLELNEDEIFMLKLALNDIYNRGNKAYEGIAKKLDRLNEQPEEKALHLPMTSKDLKEARKELQEDTSEEWKEKLENKCLEWFYSWNCGCIDILELETFIKQLLEEREDKARKEGRREMVENLLKKAEHMAKDYFTGQVNIYIDKDILEEELSKLKDKE